MRKFKRLITFTLISCMLFLIIGLDTTSILTKANTTGNIMEKSGIEEEFPLDLINSLQLFKGEIKDNNLQKGEELTSGKVSELSISSTIILKYSVKLQNDGVGDKINANVIYKLPELPNEIIFPESREQDIVEYINNKNVKIGRLILEKGSSTLKVEFIEPIDADTGNPISGLGLADIYNVIFEVGVNLDKDKIAADDQGRITLTINGNAITVIITELKPKQGELTKTVSDFDESGILTWELNYTAPTGVWDSAQTPDIIEDVIPSGLSYIDPSFEVNGVGVSNDLTVNGQTLSYKLPSLNSGASLKITYKTELTDEIVKDIWENKSINGTVKNTAEAKKGNASVIPKVSAEKEVDVNSVTNDMKLLSKEGKFNKDTRKIDWVVNIKTVSRNFEYLTLIDTMGAALVPPNSGDVKIQNESGSNINSRIEFNSVPDSNGELRTIMKIFLVEPSTPPVTAEAVYNITYSTSVKEDYFNCDSNKLQEPEDVSNSATLDFAWYSKGTGNPITLIPPTISKGPEDTGLNNSMIQKGAAGYDSKTHTLKWNITINPHKVDLKEAVITDKLPEGLIYKDETDLINNIKNEIGNILGAFADVKIENGELLTITLKDMGKNSVTFPMLTELTRKEDYKTNKTTKFTNTINMKEVKVNISGIVTDSADARSTAEQTVKSVVLEKTAIDYKPDEKKVQWKITINENQELNLGDVTITDILPLNMKCEASSMDIRINNFLIL